MKLCKKYKKINVDEINEQQKELLLKDLKIYSYIQSNWENIDNEFKNIYSNFYRLHGSGLTAKQIDNYFETFQEAKKYNLGDILCILNEKLNKCHLSFATKMLHTMNPTYPIFDSLIKKYLTDVYNIPFKSSDAIKGKRNSNAIYNWYQLLNWYSDKSHDADRDELIKWFDANYPKYKNTSNVKKVDFIIWVWSKTNKK